jgi:hypothetical protein
VQFSKLGKVMRHIAQLDQTKFAIPNEDEFNIRRRAEVLLERWQGLIAASGDAGANASAINGTGVESKVGTEEKQDEKGEEIKEVMDVDKAKLNEVPVNGDGTEVSKGSGDAAAALAAEAPVDPPTAEEEVAMDTADD